jgi:transcriptional regulator with XRE-family HTH domain
MLPAPVSQLQKRIVQNMVAITARHSSRIDVVIGRRMRVSRLLRRMSQSHLGRIVGVSFQQIQKYENGVNRISVSRLLRVSGALDVPFEYFFSGLERAPVEIKAASPPDAMAIQGLNREGAELLLAYARIRDRALRRRLRGLVAAMAEQSDSAAGCVATPKRAV